jgi:hypothetical protein
MPGVGERRSLPPPLCDAALGIAATLAAARPVVTDRAPAPETDSTLTFVEIFGALRAPPPRFGIEVAP